MAQGGYFNTYKQDILDLHKQGKPNGAILDILQVKFTELLTADRDTFFRSIRNGLLKMGLKPNNSMTGLSNTKPENVEQGREIQTTNSSTFHALKTELGLHENTFGLPEPIDDSVKSIKLPVGCDNILFIGDLQIPFHDISAITCALKYGQEHKVNTIYINGDLVDFYSISDYQTEKKKRDLVNEIFQTREFLSILRAAFPDAQIFYKKGNHEIRWERYIFNNAKAFEDLQELQFGAMFHLDKHNIHLIEDTTIVSIGSLTAIHAHEVRGVGGVFPARTLFMKTLTSAICGDCHRTSEYTGKSITDRFHTCWTVGCLSVLRPNYAPGAQYNHGLAHIRTKPDGDFSVKNFRILNGKII